MFAKHSLEFADDDSSFAENNSSFKQSDSLAKTRYYKDVWDDEKLNDMLINDILIKEFTTALTKEKGLIWEAFSKINQSKTIKDSPEYTDKKTFKEFKTILMDEIQHYFHNRYHHGFLSKETVQKYFKKMHVQKYFKEEHMQDFFKRKNINPKEIPLEKITQPEITPTKNSIETFVKELLRDTNNLNTAAIEKLAKKIKKGSQFKQHLFQLLKNKKFSNH